MDLEVLLLAIAALAKHLRGLHAARRWSDLVGTKPEASLLDSGEGPPQTLSGRGEGVANRSSEAARNRGDFTELHCNRQMSDKLVCAACGGLGHAAQVDGFTCLTKLLDIKIPSERLANIRYPGGIKPFVPRNRKAKYAHVAS